MEKYSSGRRGVPAKDVGRVTGAGVQIPPSPEKYDKSKFLPMGNEFGFIFLLKVQWLEIFL